MWAAIVRGIRSRPGTDEAFSHGHKVELAGANDEQSVPSLKDVLVLTEGDHVGGAIQSPRQLLLSL